MMPRALRDAVVGSRKGLGPEVWGEVRLFWQSAPTGHPALDLGAAVRFKTQLPPDVRQVAICTVGVHYKAKFEFAAHRAIGVSRIRSRCS